MKINIQKNINENLIDFIMNHKGNIEKYLIDFMVEQNFSTIEDYYNSQNIFTEHLINKDTNIPVNAGRQIATNFNIYEQLFYSYDTSFNTSFRS